MSAVAPPSEPAGGPAPVVDVQRVSKWMGPVVALSEVTCAIGPGVTALLGPNGAGKSTLLRIICGLTKPSQGEVRLLGVDPRKDIAVRSRLGLVAQQEPMFEDQRARAFVALSAGLHGVADADAAAVAALTTVDLDPDDTRPIRTYSKGMRQRVKVAAGIAHDPQVVVLDEPLEGLDPRQRLRMIELFVALGAAGRTVLVSSHVLDEVERFGSNVLVVAKGRLAATGDFRAIRDLMDDRPHRLRVRTDKPNALAAGLLWSGSVVGAWIEGPQSVLVDTVTVANFRRAVVQVAAADDLALLEVAPLDDDLDSVFRYLVAR